jgi:beta-N-acetylhexosaminidase
MTAHVVFDAIDRQRPATLAPNAIALLRERFGYRGVIVSDDLEMRAIADHHGVRDAACSAIASGCDALLVCSKPELTLEAHYALRQRAERDGGFRARLTEAAERCRALRATFQAAPLPPEQLEALLSRGELHDEARALQARLSLARA